MPAINTSQTRQLVAASWRKPCWSHLGPQPGTNVNKLGDRDRLLPPKSEPHGVQPPGSCRGAIDALHSLHGWMLLYSIRTETQIIDVLWSEYSVHSTEYPQSIHRDPVSSFQPLPLVARGSELSPLTHQSLDGRNDEPFGKSPVAFQSQNEPGDTARSPRPALRLRNPTVPRGY